MRIYDAISVLEREVSQEVERAEALVSLRDVLVEARQQGRVIEEQEARIEILNSEIGRLDQRRKESLSRTRAAEEKAKSDLATLARNQETHIREARSAVDEKLATFSQQEEEARQRAQSVIEIAEREIAAAQARQSLAEAKAQEAEAARQRVEDELSTYIRQLQSLQ